MIGYRRKYREMGVGNWCTPGDGSGGGFPKERDGGEMEKKSNQGREQEGGRTFRRQGKPPGKGPVWLEGLKEAQCVQST